MNGDRERRQARQLAADQAPRRVRARRRRRRAAGRIRARSPRAGPWRRSPLGKGRAPKPFMTAQDAHGRRGLEQQAARTSGGHEPSGNSGRKAEEGRRPMPALRRAAALQARGAPAGGAGWAPRDQVRRLSHAAARRGRRGDAAHPQGPRLDGQSSPPSPKPAAKLAGLHDRRRGLSRSTTTARRTSPPCRRRSRRANRTT